MTTIEIILSSIVLLMIIYLIFDPIKKKLKLQLRTAGESLINLSHKLVQKTNVAISLRKNIDHDMTIIQMHLDSIRTFEEKTKLLNENAITLRKTMKERGELISHSDDTICDLNNVIEKQGETIMEYRRTQKNDRAKIKRDESMYKSRADTIILLQGTIKQLRIELSVLIIKNANLETEIKMLSLKLRRKAPVKKK